MTGSLFLKCTMGVVVTTDMIYIYGSESHTADFASLKVETEVKGA